MSKTIVAQNQELHKQAIYMISHGQVTRNGQDGQCFISTDDGLFVANSTACSHCSSQPCAHTLAAEIYNDIRERVKRVLAQHGDDYPMSMFRRLRNALPEVGKPELRDKVRVALVICQHLHREERSREPNTFYSVCAGAGGAGVMFCPTPPKRRGRRYP